MQHSLNVLLTSSYKTASCTRHYLKTIENRAQQQSARLNSPKRLFPFCNRSFYFIVWWFNIVSGFKVPYLFWTQALAHLILKAPVFQLQLLIIWALIFWCHLSFCSCWFVLIPDSHPSAFTFLEPVKEFRPSRGNKLVQTKPSIIIKRTSVALSAGPFPFILTHCTFPDISGRWKHVSGRAQCQHITFSSSQDWVSRGIQGSDLVFPLNCRKEQSPPGSLWHGVGISRFVGVNAE